MHCLLYIICHLVLLYIYLNQMKKHGKVILEERLPAMIIASFLLPIRLFWFGWTSNPQISWVPQVIAGVPIGIGLLVIFLQRITYIIDVYLGFANSATAANTLVRSGLAGAFQLFASQMYHKLGVNWATTLPGFLTAAMIPMPILLYYYGAKLRAMSRFKFEL
jgi:DHA1 family multidrug resistance protein-like MFS transporter